MFRKFILPALAVLGVLFGIFMVRAGNKSPKVADPVAQPARSPFVSQVTGSGLVESQTRDIAIGTPVAGLVTAVYVQVNDPVHAGLPHEVVRRLVPLVTTGSAEERLDDSIAAAATSTPASQPSTRPAPVNLDTANEAELAALPGVGEAQAKRIVAGRPYASPWDLEGSPLFKIDDRQARADLAIKAAAAAQARYRLDKAVTGTRPEDLSVAKAQVDEAVAAFETAERNYQRWANVKDASAVPPDELANRKSAMGEARARRESAEANLKKLTAGTWEPDVQIARAELQAAEAEVLRAQTDLSRLTVRAPVDGRVLRVEVRPGEYATGGVLQTPLMMVGRTDVLHIRVDVDEHEAMRVRPDAKAVASIRGDSTRRATLTFVRIEPFVLPKRSLTGDSNERVDTRVLQVIYAFDPKELHAYVGQQMDVFIDAEAADKERAGK